MKTEFVVRKKEELNEETCMRQCRSIALMLREHGFITRYQQGNNSRHLLAELSFCFSHHQSPVCISVYILLSSSLN
jgi:hypothetical protein